MAPAVTESVIINEVGPRDGLQSQGRTLSPDQRLDLIEHLVGVGLRHIEAGSFVSPKAVPQMAGTDEVFRGLPAMDRVRYAALVPNMKGYELAVAAGARVVNVVLSVTETMNYENIRRTVDESAADFEQILQRAGVEGVAAQAYLAVAFECPFEGPVSPGVVRHYAERMVAAGAEKIILADTIGAANPAGVQAVLEAVGGVVPLSRVACHFHDTRGMALANVLASLNAGVREFDASIGGLGGCPFSPGATGNVATEDVALLLDAMGYDTGIDPLALVPVVRTAQAMTGTELGGKSFRWLSQQYDKQQGGAAHGR